MERKKKNDDERDDRISDLPDAILHHIFSFLNTDEAVRSSVYSKRWRHLWTSLPTLNFEYEKENFNWFSNGDGVKELVDKVFILRDGSNNITRFSLICPYLPDTGHVCSWVTSALRCNVQEMIIELDIDWLLRHPTVICCLFNSKSLTFLRLVCHSSLQLPDDDSEVCLPSLKTLFLQSVEFRDDYDMVNKLVSGCPVLESLTIRRCLFCKQFNIKIASLSLKHLVFEDNWEEFYISIESMGSLKLITPNLISFRCKDALSKRYYLEDISSLIKADICMYHSFEEYGDHDDEYIPPEVKKNRRAQRMLKFLRAFRNVKDLTLSDAILEVISGSPDLLEAEPIELCDLSILRLKTFLFHETIPAIAYLLNISPEIKSLFVEISQLDDSSDIEEYPEAETSSQCLLDNLELVEIRDAVGCVNELYFIKLLLKNAKVLKKMVVYTSKKESPEREERILKFTEKLLSFPKASSNITISMKAASQFSETRRKMLENDVFSTMLYQPSVSSCSHEFEVTINHPTKRGKVVAQKI